jgi:hypothetical protein
MFYFASGQCKPPQKIEKGKILGQFILKNRRPKRIPAYESSRISIGKFNSDDNSSGAAPNPQSTAGHCTTASRAATAPDEESGLASASPFLPLPVGAWRSASTRG